MHDVGAPAKNTQQNRGSLVRFRAVVTFERDRGDPDCWRGEIVDSSADGAVRRAVFRAESALTPRKWESVVIVLDRLPGAAQDRDTETAAVPV
jgi:hypothetical protein